MATVKTIIQVGDEDIPNNISLHGKTLVSIKLPHDFELRIPVEVMDELIDVYHSLLQL